MSTLSSPSLRTLSAALYGLLTLLGLACGGSKSSSPEETGQSCTPTSEAPAGTCFKDLQASIKGTPICLAQGDGYCTHTCQTDSDCCAVKGECKTGLPQVCSPFESNGQKYCFLSCEGSAIPQGTDDNTYCQTNANDAFICRSTGGGNENRKVCLPNG